MKGTPICHRNGKANGESNKEEQAEDVQVVAHLSWSVIVVNTIVWDQRWRRNARYLLWLLSTSLTERDQRWKVNARYPLWPLSTSSTERSSWAWSSSQQRWWSKSLMRPGKGQRCGSLKIYLKGIFTLLKAFWALFGRQNMKEYNVTFNDTCRITWQAGFNFTAWNQT